MIFEVSPEQIERLDSKELVGLLRKLLYAEAQLAGISLRGVSVPLQITIADGGEDARIEWSDGDPATSYLPGRFTVFQSKATDPGIAGWKKEIWSAASRRSKARQKGKPKKRPKIKPTLNQAIKTAIKNGGSYIGFTSVPLGEPKCDERVEAIKTGIIEAGGTPELLAAIDIYDSNKIAAWASLHPSVAVWLYERAEGIALSGFQTLDGWGNHSHISAVSYIEDSATRYVLLGRGPINDEETGSVSDNGLSFQQAKERISDHLTEPHRSVRVVGPSGIGKTRFVYELIKAVASSGNVSALAGAIYSDYRSVGSKLVEVASAIARVGSPALLVVDECPREIAARLHDVASGSGSRLCAITIDIEAKPIAGEGCLNIAVGRSGDALIEAIISARLKNKTDSEVTYIKNICGGFPRIAVLATDNYAQSKALLSSIGDVVDRILIGSQITDKDDIRAIEVLALFERLGVDEEVGHQLEYVAEHLAGVDADRMYESLARASQHQLVEKRGRFFLAQPFPIATFLAMRRLDHIRINRISEFIENAPEELLLNLFKRWRTFDGSRVAMRAAEIALSNHGRLGTRERVQSDFGGRCVDALVHVAPDAVAAMLDRVFEGVSIDQLKSESRERRNLVFALERLVFRSASFEIAARLLLRFAAGENEQWGNNATGQFKQLFQLHLSGTEVSPDERFGVLDEGLRSDDERVIEVCVTALSETLNRHHFTRSGGAEEIGGKPPLKDWSAKFWKEVFDFHRAGLKRLASLRKTRAKYAERCETIIADHIRELIHPSLLSDIEDIIDEVVKEKGIWLKAIERIGDWLYFDRIGAPSEFGSKVRQLYTRLLPTEPIDRALLYTKFWSADIRDPDANYSENDRDFEYSTRMAREVASEIAANMDLSERAIRVMVAEELHNAFPFARELALRLDNPLDAFRFAIATYENAQEKKGTQFIRGMLNGIDKRDPALASECVRLALHSPALTNQAANIYAAISIDARRIVEIVDKLRDGTLRASDCAYLSYGKTLDGLTANELVPFLLELTLHGTAGTWTALEVITMYQLGRPTLEPKIAAVIIQVTTSSDLLRDAREASRDGYLFESAVSLMQKMGNLEDKYVIALCDQVTRLCQVDGYTTFFNLKDSVRKVLAVLLRSKPSIVWESLARFYEISTPVERNALERLVGSPGHEFDGTSHTGAGILFNVTEESYVRWAKGDAAHRVGFLCAFCPVLEFDDAGTARWHPAIERLGVEFGHEEEFRDALGLRLYPRSWSGSIVPHLRIWLAPLKSWRAHHVPQLRWWAQKSHRAVERQIAAERSREEE